MDVHYGPSMKSQGKTPWKEPVFTGSAGAFHLERPLKFQFIAFEWSFQVKYPHIVAVKTLQDHSMRYFTLTS